jgi:type I restriction enzyme, S subunit
MFVPSLDLQLSTLRELESVTSQIDHLVDQIEIALSQTETLQRAILKKAFSGELVAYNSSDEPASVLLERIKAEQTIVKKSKKKEAA